MSLGWLKIEHVRKAGGGGESESEAKSDDEIRNLDWYRVGVLLVPFLVGDNFKYFHRTISIFVIKLTGGCCFSINIKSFNDI